MVYAMEIKHTRERDIRNLQQAVLNVGYYYTLEEIELAWSRYSESMAAGWMGFPEPGNWDNDVSTYKIIRNHMLWDDNIFDY